MVEDSLPYKCVFFTPHTIKQTMLGGNLDWVAPVITPEPAPAPPPSRRRCRRSPSPPPRRRASPSEQPPFRPAPLPVRHRTPPKARKKKRRIVHVEEPSYDEPQRGDLRERIDTVQRRPPSATGAGLDPRPRLRPGRSLDRRARSSTFLRVRLGACRQCLEGERRYLHTAAASAAQGSDRNHVISIRVLRVCHSGGIRIIY